MKTITLTPNETAMLEKILRKEASALQMAIYKNGYDVGREPLLEDERIVLDMLVKVNPNA